MTGTSPRLARCYDVHGVSLEIRAEVTAVIEAMDFRLRGFPPAETPDTASGVGLDFVCREPADDPLDRQSSQSRPVYDTPHGSLYYRAEDDTLAGSFDSVHLSCLAARGSAVLGSAEFTGRALYLATHPLATIAIMELMERRGRFSLHAAGLASGSGSGVLLAGASGAGKSTLALALARAGLNLLGDDVVFIAGTESGPVDVLGFADALGLTEASARHFPELRGFLDEPEPTGFRKRLVRIEDLSYAPAVNVCRPRVLVFPSVAVGEPSAIAPLESSEALIRLVPDVLLTEPAATQAHLAAIAALVEQVDCYELRSGVDLDRAVELVRVLL